MVQNAGKKQCGKQQHRTVEKRDRESTTTTRTVFSNPNYIPWQDLWKKYQIRNTTYNNNNTCMWYGIQDIIVIMFAYFIRIRDWLGKLSFPWTAFQLIFSNFKGFRPQYM